MKRWFFCAPALLAALSLVSSAEAGRWHRWGRSTGFGWSDGYHAPNSSNHWGYNPPAYWDKLSPGPAVENVPAARTFELTPTPAPLPPKNGDPSPTATRPLWRATHNGY